MIIIKSKNEPMKKAQEAIKAYRDKGKENTDPNGSWTGVCEEKNEIPVQDADDL